MSTVSDGTTTVTPDMVLGYESTREIRNQVHQIIGKSAPTVSVKPAGLRTGELEYLCKDLSTALALEQLHRGTAVLTLTLTDRSTLSMLYVPVDEITVTLDDDTRDAWIVTTGFQEVAP